MAIRVTVVYTTDAQLSKFLKKALKTGVQITGITFGERSGKKAYTFSIDNAARYQIKWIIAASPGIEKWAPPNS